MKSIDDQFIKCGYIFMQNKIFVPILCGILLTAVAISFSFGHKMSATQSKIKKMESYYEILLDIKESVDSLVAK